MRPLIDGKFFTFAEVANAHARAESGEAIGKIVLEQFSFNKQNLGDADSKV